jgi:MoaA/NifB/PqqE/SkfB family radical SAM enzyme
VTGAAPRVALKALDHLWFQVTGTLCNLSCRHCFISCHPDNHLFGFLSLETVRRFLEESVALGVKEYYFTGGEPFLHPQMVEIIEETLRIGPATVLTNGTVFRDALVARLRDLSERSRFSLELRVSIDGPDPGTNDPVRGEGTFEAAMRGVGLLARAGFLPILTAVQTWEDRETPRMLRAFEEALRRAGSTRPRLKIIPTLRIGMEEKRTRGYREDERVTEEMLEGYDQDQLVCNHSRMVTDRGVAVCPILIEAPDAHLGKTLREALGPFPLRHQACSTCYLHGAICSNPGLSGSE